MHSSVMIAVEAFTKVERRKRSLAKAEQELSDCVQSLAIHHPELLDEYRDETQQILDREDEKERV